MSDKIYLTSVHGTLSVRPIEKKKVNDILQKYFTKIFYKKKKKKKKKKRRNE